MPKTIREDTEPLSSTLTVTVERSDYLPRLNSELAKYRKQAQMKGFRKGRTPMSVVRKMYGRSVLAEVVNQLMQEELYRYLTEEDIEILGQPLPSESQEQLDFDLKEPQDYMIKFDVGRAPSFEVAGVDETNTFEKYKVDIPESEVDEALEAARRRQGKRVNPETAGDENDVVRLQAVELEGEGPKEDGVQSEFSLLLSRIDDEGTRERFFGKQVGDQLDLDLFSLEKDTDEAYVRKHFLQLEEDDDRPVNHDFRLTLEEISRVEPAELNEEFFQAAFPGRDASSEEEAREAIREDLAKHYDSQAEALLFRDIQDDLLEKNELALPHDFLKRWLLASNEQATAEIIANEYDRFAENLRWSLIKGKLVKRFDLEVKPEELKDRFRDQVRGYFGGSTDNEAFVDSMVERLMQDKKQVDSVYEDLMADKLYDAVVDVVSVKDKPIGLDAFKEVLEEARREREAAQTPAPAASEEE